MAIDWTHFTPWASLIGGALIGIAASLLLLFNGRIAGISGIVGGLLQARRHPVGWRIAFIAGLLLASFVGHMLAWQAPAPVNDNTVTLIVAGLLVGIGTRYAAGCTSGHGVCGLSRGSARSMVATLAFMLAGFATVFVIRHLLA